MSSGDWMCSSCQHVNFKKRESCQRCRFPKFGGVIGMSSFGVKTNEVLAGDWYCTAMNCGAHNYASRASCYRCSASYLGATTYPYEGDSPPGWKKGDWLCTRLGCGVHNYACRMECYKCKITRDYGDAI